MALGSDSTRRRGSGSARPPGAAPGDATKDGVGQLSSTLGARGRALRMRTDGSAEESPHNRTFPGGAGMH